MHCVNSIVVALWLVNLATAQSGEVAAITRLREQGQYETAEREGVALWQRADLADRERAELAIELALVVTEQALAAGAPEARELHWAKAENVCDAFVEGWPESPRRALVEVQRALVSLARGEQSRASRNLPAAIDHLRAATRKLVEVGDAVGRELVERRLRAQETAPPDALSVEELESLESHIAYQLARAERQTALCHPLGSPDRDDALLQAVKRLAPIVRQSPPDGLVWNARVELVACRRELGDGDVAKKLLAVWLREEPPEFVRAQLAAEVDRPQAPLSTSGDLFRDAVVAAAGERQAGRITESLQAYRRAALEHRTNPQADEAHQAAILCMADLMRASAPADRAALVRTYVDLLEEHLEHFAAQPTADEVRLWQGQLLVARQDWPAATATLEQVRRASESFAASMKLVVQCYESRLGALAGRADVANTEQAQLLTSATQFLQPIVVGKESRWPQSWSEVQREATLGLARLHLRYANPTSAYAEQLLTAAVRGSAASDAEDVVAWRATAQSLLVAALARRGKLPEAQAIAKQMGIVPPDRLLEALSSLSDVAAKQGEASDQQQVGKLMLTIVRQVEVRHTELDASQLGKLDRYRAAALAMTGDWAGAATQYAAIAAASPDDGEIQENYAALLGQSDAPEHLRQALARWAAVEMRSRRGGERWLRARRARIEILRRIGDHAEAEKLVRLTQLLYPDWDALPADAK
jgi:hypothetical protein